MIKGPFTTNHHCIRYVSSKSEIIPNLVSVASNLEVDIGYLMVQPRMRNQFERKFACMGGEVRYLTKCSTGTGKAYPVDEAMAFAQQALNVARQRLGEHLIWQGLFRVDVFEVRPGKYVVNEFESLDADVHSAARTPSDEGRLRNDLIQFWYNIICIETKNLLTTLSYA